MSNFCFFSLLVAHALGISPQRSPSDVLFDSSIRSAAAATAVPGGVSTLIAESYVHIRWPWISFLAAQVVLSAAFLLGVMVQTAVWQVKVVKGAGSAMTTLLALSPADRERLSLVSAAGVTSTLGNGAETAQRLEGVQCRFKLEGGGWVLEVVDGSSGQASGVER